MEPIHVILQREKELSQSTQPRITTTRNNFKVHGNPDDIGVGLCNIAERLIKDRGQKHNFNLDSQNQNAVAEIAHYLACSPKFKGDLNKGLMIRGTVGTGKTLLLQAIAEMMTYYRMIIPIVTAMEIIDRYASGKSSLISKLETGILVIDDLGTEETEINVYGSIRRPLYELITIRHARQKLTFITTNLTPTEIEQKYGDRIRDRIREMCNQIVLTGKSRRL